MPHYLGLTLISLERHPIPMLPIHYFAEWFAVYKPSAPLFPGPIRKRNFFLESYLKANPQRHGLHSTLTQAADVPY